MGVATPIWHDLRFKACNDGTVARIRPATPILQASFMPDQYLYFDGWAVDLNGARTYSSLPIIAGDFPKFTNMSDPTFTVPNQFFTCAKDKGQNGNPWDMDPPLPWSISPDFNPDTVHPCSNDDYTPGTQYTP